jgi:transaldolase
LTALACVALHGAVAFAHEDPMKIFIDSADLAEIRDAAAMGVIDGVTTNPTLIAKSGKRLPDVIAAICEIVDGPISAEVLAVDCDGIVSEGKVLAAIHPNVVVKVPLIPEGLKAVRIFSEQGIRTNVTLCFNANQAMFAAKAGATYISPFLGRIDDIGGDGLELIDQIVTIYGNYAMKTQVLAASIRHPVHVTRCAEMGADVATLPHKVILQLLQHPLTERGLATFLEDAKKIPK